MNVTSERCEGSAVDSLNSGARSAQADEAEQSQNDDDRADDVDDLAHGVPLNWSGL